MLSAMVVLTVVVLIGWLLLWMLAQKPATSIQNLIHAHRYEEAITEADRLIDRNGRDGGAHLHRAEALKLIGRFEEAIASYRRVLEIAPDDAAAAEGMALSLAHVGRNLDEARRLMEQTIASYPQIQEFQALALAYILLRAGARDEALRLFEDNLVLLQTRFKDDYTDPDPMLAETLVLFAELSEAAGDVDRGATLRGQAAVWAPHSVWASART